MIKPKRITATATPRMRRAVKLSMHTDSEKQNSETKEEMRVTAGRQEQKKTQKTVLCEFKDRGFFISVCSAVLLNQLDVIFEVVCFTVSISPAGIDKNLSAGRTKTRPRIQQFVEI